MYTVTVTVNRPVNVIPYYAASSADARDQVKQYYALQAAASGFVGYKVTRPTNVQIVIINTWQDKSSYDSFMAANADFIAQLTADRNAYQDEHGITREEAMQQMAVKKKK